MKRKDLNDLKQVGISDLLKKEKEARKDLTQTMVELKLGKDKNVHILNNKRKNLARILTLKKIAEYKLITVKEIK